MKWIRMRSKGRHPIYRIFAEISSCHLDDSAVGFNVALWRTSSLTDPVSSSSNFVWRSAIAH
jgi:hypothetical protein